MEHPYQQLISQLQTAFEEKGGWNGQKEQIFLAVQEVLGCCSEQGNKVLVNSYCDCECHTVSL